MARKGPEFTYGEWLGTAKVQWMPGGVAYSQGNADPALGLSLSS